MGWKRWWLGVLAVAEASCPTNHVELIDGTCELSWQDGMAVKPPHPSIRTLCEVDPSMLEQLQSYVERLPEDAWAEPAARFTNPSTSYHDAKMDYRQVNFHYVQQRNTAYSAYEMYPLAKDFHAMVEPLLLNITKRFNYDTEELPAAQGFMTKSIPRLILAKLGPGHQQAAHLDLGSSSLVPHKIHIPLSDGGGKAIFAQVPPPKKGGPRTEPPPAWVRTVLKPGYAYEVNNLLKHHAQNDGDSDRVHLLFEYLPRDVGSEWVLDRRGPLTQTELQAKLARERQAMTPEELKKHLAEKQKLRDQRQEQLRARVDLGNQVPGRPGKGGKGGARKATEEL